MDGYDMTITIAVPFVPSLMRVYRSFTALLCILIVRASGRPEDLIDRTQCRGLKT